MRGGMSDEVAALFRAALDAYSEERGEDDGLRPSDRATFALSDYLREYHPDVRASTGEVRVTTAEEEARMAAIGRIAWARSVAMQDLGDALNHMNIEGQAAIIYQAMGFLLAQLPPPRG